MWVWCMTQQASICCDYTQCTQERQLTRCTSECCITINRSAATTHNALERGNSRCTSECCVTYALMLSMRLDSTRKVLSHGMCASNMTESGTPGNNSRQLRHITGTQAHGQVSSHTMEVGRRGLRTKVRRDEAGEKKRNSQPCRRGTGLT